jgi:hypothetical protein
MVMRRSSPSSFAPLAWLGRVQARLGRLPARLAVLCAPLLAAPLAACAGSTQAPTSPAVTEDPAARVAAFEAAEDEILRDLAASDRRFAQRARIVPRDEDVRRIAIGAVLAEDPSIAVVDGAIDPFSFEARARALAAVRKKLERAPRNLPASAPGTTPEPALEHELLVRLVDEEEARLAEERKLPRSASALVRGIVQTWTPPGSPEEVAAHDRWLSRRLGEVREALAKTPLDIVRARDLDDALDALEHDIDEPGFTASTQELVRLRDAIESQGSQPLARSEWTTLARALQAHLGVAMSAEELDAKLASAEVTSRAAAEREIAASKLLPDDLASRTAPLMFGTKPCVAAVPGSRVRAMSPPPERLAACEIRRDLARATVADRAALAATLTALHDHVVVAQWTLEVARGAATIQAATARHHLLARPAPDDQARLERIAFARPVTAIGAGVTAVVLLEDGGDPIARARAWAALGDVPLDPALAARGK